jgi:Fe-S cluster biogenesis protein NfuA
MSKFNLVEVISTEIELLGGCLFCMARLLSAKYQQTDLKEQKSQLTHVSTIEFVHPKFV